MCVQSANNFVCFIFHLNELRLVLLVRNDTLIVIIIRCHCFGLEPLLCLRLKKEPNLKSKRTERTITSKFQTDWSARAPSSLLRDSILSLNIAIPVSLCLDFLVLIFFCYCKYCATTAILQLHHITREAQSLSQCSFRCVGNNVNEFSVQLRFCAIAFT